MKGITILLYALLFLYAVESFGGDKIDHSINQISKANGIDPELVRAIIRVESGFKIGAYNKKTRDYGLMQINITHINRLRLSKRRLLRDAHYNIQNGVKILVWFRDQYEHRLGSAWVARYNCGTYTGCELSPRGLGYSKRVYAAVPGVPFRGLSTSYTIGVKDLVSQVFKI